MVKIEILSTCSLPRWKIARFCFPPTFYAKSLMQAMQSKCAKNASDTAAKCKDRSGVCSW